MKKDNKYEEMTEEDLNKKIAEIKLFNDLEHGDALAFERREGIKIGEKSANIKTAKYLLSINMPTHQIEKATGLSKDEIEKLK